MYCRVEFSSSKTDRKRNATWEHFDNDRWHDTSIMRFNVARCCNSCNAKQGQKITSSMAHFGLLCREEYQPAYGGDRCEALLTNAPRLTGIILRTLASLMKQHANNRLELTQVASVRYRAIVEAVFQADAVVVGNLSASVTEDRNFQWRCFCHRGDAHFLVDFAFMLFWIEKHFGCMNRPNEITRYVGPARRAIGRRLPLDKTAHPGPGLIDPRKGPLGIAGPVLQRLEQRFRIRVIVADSRPTKRGGHPNRSSVANKVAPFIGAPLSE